MLHSMSVPYFLSMQLEVNQYVWEAITLDTKFTYGIPMKLYMFAAMAIINQGPFTNMN